VWVGVHEPTSAELKAIGFSFQLNAAAVEEALDDGLRPKVEQYDGTTLIVLRPVRYVEPADATRDGEVETAAIVIFCGVHFLITVRYGEAAALRQVRRDLESHPELLRQGAWSVVCGIAERVVDEYLSVAHEVECDLDELEARVLEMDSRQAIARLRQFKRGIVDFKRAVLPLQRPLGALVAGHPVIIPAGLAPFLRGASDRLGLAAEQVRSFDDLLNYLMTSHLATIDVEQNRDMRKIAAWASVAALWGIVAGIYEMTQDFTSLHRDHNGLMFGGTVAATAITSILLYLRFRRAGWL